MPSKAEALLAVLHQYAYAPDEHQACANLYSDTMTHMLDHSLTREEIEKAVELTIACAIVDGLRYGHWPWSRTPPPGVPQTEGLHLPDLEKGPF